MGNAFAVREKAVYDESFEANVDMSSDQYKIVKLHTVVGQVVLAGAGEGIGVLQNKPGAGQEAQVRIFGLTRLVTDGGTDASDLLKSDASGLATATTIAGDLLLARQLVPQQGANTIISALLIGPQRRHV